MMLNRRQTIGLIAAPALAAPRLVRAADDIVVGATVPITGALAGSGL